LPSTAIERFEQPVVALLLYERLVVASSLGAGSMA
jgi:hypothetical protein